MRTLSALALAALGGPATNVLLDRGGNPITDNLGAQITEGSPASRLTIVERWIVRVTLPGPTIFGASDGPDTFVWNNGSTGNVTFIGCDAALTVALPPLTGTPRADPATVSLSATDPRLLAQLLAEPYRNAPCDICLLIFENGVPGEEWLKFRGVCGETTFTDAAAKLSAAGKDAEQPTASTIAMTVWPATVDMKRGNGRWATNVDQQLFRDAADTFFQDVALVGVSTINWGQAGASSPAASATTKSAEGAPSGLASLAGGLAGRFGGPGGIF